MKQQKKNHKYLWETQGKIGRGHKCKLISAPSTGKETKVLSKNFSIKGWNKEGFPSNNHNILLKRLNHSLTFVYLHTLILSILLARKFPNYDYLQHMSSFLCTYSQMVDIDLQC